MALDNTFNNTPLISSKNITYEETLFRQKVLEFSKDPDLTSMDIVSRAFWAACPEQHAAILADGEFEAVDAEFRKVFAPAFILNLCLAGYDVYPEES